MTVKLRLPALSDRATRVRLLAWSYDDASTGIDDGGRGSKAASRIPGRYEYLWRNGSYWELERASDRLKTTAPMLHRIFWELYTARDWLSAPAGRSLHAITDLMPRNVFVPQDIAEVAGYSTGEAKTYVRPRR